MGLSSLPAPSEGVLCVILVNTALSLSIFKGFVRTILHIVGIRFSSSSSQPQPQPQALPEARPADHTEARPDHHHQQASSPEQQQPCRGCCSYVEEFRSRIPTIAYREAARGTAGGGDHQDCSVCLSEFEAESEINHLACGHLFHNVCLEKWLDYNYWNITCPLCRTPLMPEEDISCFW